MPESSIHSLRILLASSLLLPLMVGPASVEAQREPCGTSYNNSNGPQSLFLNIHNCGLDCALQESPYINLVKDGVTGVRVAPVTLDNTAAPDPGFYTVNDFDPYFEDLLEIFGPDKLLVLIDDGVDEGPYAKPTPNNILRKLSSLLVRTPAVRHIEFMNEPLNFSSISPEEYVARYLRPARALVDRFNADRASDNQIFLYSAAWIGTADGIRRARRMVRSGGLAYVDAMTAHIYERIPENAERRAREYKRLARGKPIAITETNFNASNRSDYAAHPWWICESMTQMEQVMRQGLSAEDLRFQHNVFYTLRADSSRLFNLIRFPDFKALAWTFTGPGHFILIERSKIPTDPKQLFRAPEEREEEEEGAGASGTGGPERPSGRRN